MPTSEFHCPECCPGKKPTHHRVLIYIANIAVPVVVSAVVVLLLKWVGI